MFRTPLGLFSTLWAVAACLHDLEQRPLDGLPLYPFALLLLFFPERICAIATFALAHLVLLSFDLPAPANHVVLSMLVDATLLIGCAATLQTAPPDRGKKLWESVRGPLQATLLIVYAFTVFHKLNKSFLDPEVSCATGQMARMLLMHGLQPASPWTAFAFNIYVTLIAESAIVVLLLLPRFVYVGALVGLMFHTGLAWAQFFDFSSVVLSLYLFFFPWDRLQQDIGRIPGWVRVCFFASLTALAVTSFWCYGLRETPVIAPGPLWTFRAETPICLFWTVMMLPIVVPVFWHGVVRRDDRRWRGSALAWLIPAIALVNGATPYLGLKTVSNYSMFSNLRTEGGQTNHLLMPAGAFFVSHDQDDLARVWYIDGVAPDEWPWWVRLNGGPAHLRRQAQWLPSLPGARLPFFELRRTVQLWQDAGITQIAVDYERDGKRYQLGVLADPAVMQRLSWWEQRLMAFRAVQEDGQPSVCRW